MANYKVGSDEYEAQQKKIKTVYSSQAAYNAAHKAEIDAGTLKPSNTVVHARGVDTDNPESVRRAEQEHEAAIDSWRISQGLEPHSDKFWSKDSTRRRGADYSGYDSGLRARYDLDRQKQEAANLAPLQKGSAYSVSSAGAEEALKKQTTPKSTTPALPTPTKPQTTLTPLQQLQLAQDRSTMSDKELAAAAYAARVGQPTAQSTTTPVSSTQPYAGAIRQTVQATQTPVKQAVEPRTETTTKAAPQTAVQRRAAIFDRLMAAPAQTTQTAKPSALPNVSPAMQTRTRIGEGIAERTIALDEAMKQAEGFIPALVNVFRSAPAGAVSGALNMEAERTAGENSKYSDAVRKAAENTSEARALRKIAQQQFQKSLEGKSELEQTLMNGTYSLVENVSYLLFSPKGAFLPLLAAGQSADAFDGYRAIGVPVGEAIARASTEGIISAAVESIGGIGAGDLANQVLTKSLGKTVSKIMGKDMTEAIAAATGKLIPAVLMSAGGEAFEEVVEYPAQVLSAYLYNMAFGNTAGNVPASWAQALEDVKRNAAAALVAGGVFGGVGHMRNSVNANYSANPTTPTAPTTPTTPTAQTQTQTPQTAVPPTQTPVQPIQPIQQTVPVENTIPSQPPVNAPTIDSTIQTYPNTNSPTELKTDGIVSGVEDSTAQENIPLQTEEADRLVEMVETPAVERPAVYAVTEIGSGKSNRYMIRQFVEPNASNPVGTKSYKTAEAAQAAAQEMGLPLTATDQIAEAFARPIVGQAVNPAAARIEEAFAEGMPQGEPTFGPRTVGAAQRNPKSYSALADEYGTYEPGENPARVVDVPLQTSDTDKVRRFTRNLMEASITPDTYLQYFESAVESGVFSNQSKTEAQTLDNAARLAGAAPFGDSVAAWSRAFSTNQALNDDTLVLGQLVYATAIKNGDAELALKTAAQLAASYTEAGRAVQSARLLKKLFANSADQFAKSAQVYYYQTMAERLGKRFNATVALDPALTKNLLNANTEEEVNAARDAIARSLGAQLPTGTPAEKWNTWRYIAMLGNPKTIIRNIVGNIVMKPAVALKEAVKAGIERLPGVSKLGVTKETTLAMPTKTQTDFAKKDFEAVQDEMFAGNKYDDGMSAIIDQRAIFRSGALEAARKGINWSMNNAAFGDVAFLRGSFVDAEARYFRANNIDPNTATGRQINEARAYAVEIAREATFRKASAVAAALSKFSRSNPVLNVLVEGVLPFKGVPMNILRSGMEYSPLGLLKSVTVDSARVKNGTMTANQMVDHLSSGLVGTGISILGYFLSDMGLLIAGDEDKDKENTFNDLQGLQRYALRIGDSTYTIDWLAPLCIPLFIGAEFRNLVEGDAELKNLGDITGAVLNAMDTVADPLVGLSMLSGLSSTLASAAYGDGITSLFTGVMQSYIMQAFPTVAKQIARTVAPTAQTPYFTDKTDAVADTVQPFLNKILTGLPGAQQGMDKLGIDYTIPSRMDAWGQKDTAPLGERILENFFSPGYFAKVDNSEVNQGIRDLYKKTGDASVLPSKIGNSYTVDGTTKYYSTKDYERAQGIAGQTAQKLLDQLFVSPQYKGLSTEQKQDLVTDIYDHAKGLAKETVAGVDVPTSQIEKYQQTGLPMNGQIQLYEILNTQQDSPAKDAKIASTFGVNEYEAKDYRRMASGSYYGTLDDIGDSAKDKELTAKKAAKLAEYGFSEEDVVACYNAHAGSGQKKEDYLRDAQYALEAQGYSAKDAETMAGVYYAVANQLKGYKVG